MLWGRAGGVARKEALEGTVGKGGWEGWKYG